jgi:DNA-binding MarR family transcriptional regulator
MTTHEAAIEIDTFLNNVRLLADNQREILLGSQATRLTSTQGHILMLLAQEGPQTNTELASKLQVSPAAMTKAMRRLLEIDDPMVTAMPDEDDKRITRWSLTTQGISAATDHSQLHKDTVATYEDILADFTHEQQATITRFLTELDDRILGGDHA